MHIIPSFLVDKASCTRQFESELSLHSLALLFPIKEGIFSNPSVSLSKGSSTSNQAFLLRRKDVAGYAIASARVWYRQRSLCPQGAADDCLRNRIAIVCRLAHHYYFIYETIYHIYANRNNILTFENK